jgi:hypothetical protein
MVVGEGVGLLRKSRRKMSESIGSVVSSQAARRRWEYLAHGEEIDLRDWHSIPVAQFADVLEG